MADGDRPSRLRYRFSPLERRGIIAGWRGGQIASVAASLVMAVLALRAAASIAGLAAAVSVVAVGVGVAFWPVRGRTVEQWLPLVGAWSLAGPTGRLQLAPGPRRGHVVAARPGTAGPMPLPASTPNLLSGTRRAVGRRAVFDGLRLVGVPFGTDGAGIAGVVLDARARTATAVLALRGHSFALLSPSDQEGRIGAWASVLASLAREGSAVHRLQWVEICLPDGGDGVRRHFDRRTADRGGPSRAVDSYGALLDESTPVTRRHRVLLSLAVHASAASRRSRPTGTGHAALTAVLGRELRALRRALEGADIWVDGVLGIGALAGVLREAVTPSAGGAVGGELPDPPPEPSPGRDPAAVADAERHPWPMAVRPEWDAVRTDGTWHATYWIAEWPRVDVTPDFLGPLFFVPLRRTISLVMEPMSPARAARQVARARTEDIADDELRRRSGFLVGARQRRVRHGVEERDAELAEGHGQFRFAGYVTVTGDSREALDAATTDLEQLAGHSHLELRRLYGEQDLAFACSLPLARGLP
jgi:hypothetical protein